MKKPIVNKDFIVNLKGKDFIKYEGLLDMGHQVNLKSIRTDIIQIPTKENEMTCIVKAVITTAEGKVFEGLGDASPISVTNMLIPHLIRMAETRAKARALRDLTNIGMTATEELGDEDIDIDYRSSYFNQNSSHQGFNNNNNTNNRARTQSPAQGQNNSFNCADCGTGINQKIYNYSMNKFKKPLCYNCQNPTK